jgi:hypothetical protein
MNSALEVTRLRDPQFFVAITISIRTTAPPQ